MRYVYNETRSHGYVFSLHHNTLLEHIRIRNSLPPMKNLISIPKGMPSPAGQEYIEFSNSNCH